MEKAKTTSSAASRVKNKEKSKQELLDAVGKLLVKKGHHALKVNDIAAMAGLDKKLIYRYFGSTEQLLDEFLQSRDFWSNINETRVPQNLSDGGQAFTKAMLHEQFDTVFENKEFQHVLLWRLSQQRSSLEKLVEQQEASGEKLFQNIIQPRFKNNTPIFRAISAILISGLYYLDLSTGHNGSTFCGLDMSSSKDREEVKKAIDFLIEQTYQSL